MLLLIPPWPSLLVPILDTDRPCARPPPRNGPFAFGGAEGIALSPGKFGRSACGIPTELTSAQGMAPRKPKAPRAVARKRRASASPVLGDRGAALLPVARKRQRREGRQDASEDEASDQYSPARAPKRQKASAVPPPMDSSSADGEQPPQGTDGSAADRPMDTHPPFRAASGERGKKTKRGIDSGSRPISDVREMFEDMVERLNPSTLKERPVKLNVATLCSGTDAPIFALGLIQEAMQATGFGTPFEFEHVFSCEIEPFKQGFIRRNLPEGTLIFRDVVELAAAKDRA